MSAARVDGKPASLAAAVERAAEILSQAQMPVVTGLGTDVAGARAAILLAGQLRGAYDHMFSGQIFAGLDVMRQSGLMFTTPSEARLRADVFLFIGKNLLQAWPEMMERLSPAATPPFDLAREKRKLLWLGPGRAAKIEGLPIEVLDSPNLHAALACLRARAGGKPVSGSKSARQKFDEFAEVLKAARFGVAVWSSDSLDSLAIEMLHGLIRDLNETTRFSGLPLGAGANASGVVQTSGWMTGFPVRTSFGRGFPEHDTWRFDTTRMIESGEADAALWISAYGAEAPRWKRNIPVAALVSPQTVFAREPNVYIEIGCPGLDHDAAEFGRETNSIIARPASRPSKAVSAAEVIGQIAAQLEGNA
ncbi:MAG: tungsten formylmethanofuran dehydrogenase [Beijerinckiaceae bacterium]|nr:tungsten formylmethanofuran dehydrogenase [Beijerinckiaceae bacterium]